MQFFVSDNGNDDNPGGLDLPFKTIAKAIDAPREVEGAVVLRAGTHYLDDTIQLTPADSGLTTATLSSATPYLLIPRTMTTA